MTSSIWIKSPISLFRPDYPFKSNHISKNKTCMTSEPWISTYRPVNQMDRNFWKPGDIFILQINIYEQTLNLRFPWLRLQQKNKRGRWVSLNKDKQSNDTVPLSLWPGPVSVSGCTRWRTASSTGSWRTVVRSPGGRWSPTPVSRYRGWWLVG